jgi:hypothetical protein
MSDAKRIEELLNRLDGSASKREWDAVTQLRELGNALPAWLLKKFRASSKWEARTSCVYHAIRYAQQSDDAVNLGREAIRDRSRKVRYRGCMLLAYSQKEGVLPDLKAALVALREGPGADDLRAAIDAIESHKFDYFLDRSHSGMVKIEFLDEFLRNLKGPQ